MLKKYVCRQYKIRNISCGWKSGVIHYTKSFIMLVHMVGTLYFLYYEDELKSSLGVSMAEWLSYWTADSKWVSSNPTRITTSIFGRILVGKVRTPLYPLVLGVAYGGRLPKQTIQLSVLTRNQTKDSWTWNLAVPGSGTGRRMRVDDATQ